MDHLQGCHLWELLGLRNQTRVFCTLQIKQFWLQERRKKEGGGKGHAHTLVSPYINFKLWCGRLYSFHSFSQERCLWYGRFYMLGRRKSVQAGNFLSMRESWQPCIWYWNNMIWIWLFITLPSSPKPSFPRIARQMEPEDRLFFWRTGKTGIILERKACFITLSHAHFHSWSQVCLSNRSISKRYPKRDVASWVEKKSNFKSISCSCHRIL